MKNTNKPLQVGLLGSGGRLRGVVKNLLTKTGENVQIAAMYDPDPGSAFATREDFGAQVVPCGSEKELVNRSDLDWIFIGSPNAHHARQAILALRAGKNVFCEKPLAIDLEDCHRVRGAARETGRIFAFGLVLRYSPHYQKIRELIQSGTIGQLISFEFNETLHFDHGGYIFGNWRRKRELAGPHLLEKCCHDLDLANWIIASRPRRAASFGGRNFFIPANQNHIDRVGPNPDGKPAFQTWPDPHRVNPFSEGADIVDNQVAILEYENGVRATFHTNCSTAISERRMYLCGTEGTLRADALTGGIEWQRIGYDTQRETLDSGSNESHGGGDEVMAQGLANTLLKSEAPLASVEDGFLACLTAAGIDGAMDTGTVTDYAPLYAKWNVPSGR